MRSIRINIVVSDTQAYKQFGNAVVPKVVEAVGRQIVRVLALEGGGKRMPAQDGPTSLYLAMTAR